MYEYRARVLDVYDGDTLTVVVDLGFDVSVTRKIRLLGINTPEIRTRDKREKRLGLEARDFLREQVLGRDVVVQTSKPDKYGRSLCMMFRDVICINDLMVEMNYARRYWGGKREPWFGSVV